MEVLEQEIKKRIGKGSTMEYWTDFEGMVIRYSFEAYNDKTGYSGGEEFDTLSEALDAFENWELDEWEQGKRVCVDVYVPTVRGELDLFKSVEALKEEKGAPRYMSITEAAEALGLSRQRVHILLTGGLLKGRKIGNTWIVERESVERRKARG